MIFSNDKQNLTKQTEGSIKELKNKSKVPKTINNMN